MYIYVSCVVFFVSYNNVEVAFTSLTRSCLWRNLWQAGAVPPLDWHQWHLMAMGICRKELDQDVYIYILYPILEYWENGTKTYMSYIDLLYLEDGKFLTSHVRLVR